MAIPITTLFGPNLNRQRASDNHGHETPDDAAAHCQALAREPGASWFRSNSEPVLIDRIYPDCDGSIGIVMDPAAFAHTSVTEAEISDIHQRDDFRHSSYVFLRVEGAIAGFGAHGYGLAVRKMPERLR